MVRSGEREGWSGSKLDLVWTFLVCIDDSAWFLKALLRYSRLFLVVIFGAISWWFSRCVFGTLLLGIWWGKFVWTLRGPLDLASFGGQNHGYGLLMRCSYYPQSLVQVRERFGRSKFRFGGVDPRVLFIPSCPGYTGLTGALDRSDRCESLVGLASSEMVDSCVFGSWCCWSVLGLFGVVLLGFG
jgi:hypothetical protein